MGRSASDSADFVYRQNYCPRPGVMVPTCRWCTMRASLDLGTQARAVKASFSLPELIGQTLPLRRSGRLWTACCPFHREKTPSFYVYADHYHCFGCGAHGDVVAWAM